MVNAPGAESSSSSGPSASSGRGPVSEQSSATAGSSLQSSQGSPDAAPATVTIADFQQLIRDMYLEKDLARGIDGTFMWLMEEVGELAAALRSGSHDERAAEFADVLAWLATIANVAGVDLTAAVQQKYGSGCPGCGALVCTCADAEKP